VNPSDIYRRRGHATRWCQSGRGAVDKEVVLPKMFTFCSLQGAQSRSSASQSLLELDGGVKVLIDVGWDESFDVTKLKELEK
jgi:hypothetical protein